jgi:hypothetical protein
MRQFFTWRWWLTIASLVGGALLLAAVIGRPGDDTLAEFVEPDPRRIDLVTVAQRVRADVGWQVRDGITREDARVRTNDGRTFRITEGTVGVNDCTQIEQRNGCAFLADTLGDAIVWFALIDVEDPTGELRLPPIATLLEGVTWARLTNGWELPLLSVVERRCSRETLNLGNFVETFGDRAFSFLDLELREISAVQCRRR